MEIEMNITKHNVRDKGLIPDLLRSQQFFNNRLSISTKARLVNGVYNWDVYVRIDINDSENPTHSYFTMDNALTGGWYDVVIRPIETISGFWKLTEISHPDIDYDAIAKYVYDLLCYLSDGNYPNINGLNYGADPNAISYYMELGNQIESYINDINQIQKGNLSYEQQFVNQVYLTNVIRLVQETTCQRAVFSVTEGNEIITFCSDADYENACMPKVLEVVYTNDKYDYLGIYTFTNKLLIEDFILPVISYIGYNSEEFLENDITIDELKQYFSILYSIQSKEIAITPTLAISNLKEENNANKVLGYIINNNIEFKCISDSIDKQNAKCIEPIDRPNQIYFKIRSLKIRNDYRSKPTTMYTITLHTVHENSKPKNYYTDASSLYQAMLNNDADKVSVNIIHNIIGNEGSDDTTEQIVLKDTSVISEKKLLHDGAPAFRSIFFMTKDDAIKWLHKVVDFSLEIAKKLIEYGKGANTRTKEWRNLVIDTLPHDNIVDLLLNEMLKPDINPDEFAKGLFNDAE